MPLVSSCVPVALVGGVTAGAMTAADRRTLSQRGVDSEIERRVHVRLDENFGPRIHVNANVYDRTLLVTGEAPTKQLLADVEALLKLTPNMKRLVNEIRVAEPSEGVWRTNDSLLTTAVKTRFGQAGAFNIAHVKVVSEAGTVFLMGMVTKKEADAAIDTARNTSAVNRVVSVFDILDDEEIRRLDGLVQSASASTEATGTQSVE